MNNENPNQLTPDPSNPSQGPEPQNQRQDIELQHKIIEPPLPPTLPPKKSKKKLWIMLILLLLIIGVGAGSAYAYLTTTADSKKATSNDSTTKTTDNKTTVSEPEITLETYESKDIGLAFDYPNTWTVTSDDNIGGKYNTFDSQLVKSPSDFTMFFNSVAPDGLGGTGPCDRKVKNFVNEGQPDIEGAYVISYTADVDFFIQLSLLSTSEDTNHDCTQHAGMINVKDRESQLSDDGMEYVGPYIVQFGSGNILDETAVSKVKPSEKEYNEAVSILKSLRKIQAS